MAGVERSEPPAKRTPQYFPRLLRARGQGPNAIGLTPLLPQTFFPNPSLIRPCEFTLIRQARQQSQHHEHQTQHHPPYPIIRLVRGNHPVCRHAGARHHPSRHQPPGLVRIPDPRRADWRDRCPACRQGKGQIRHHRIPPRNHRRHCPIDSTAMGPRPHHRDQDNRGSRVRRRAPMAMALPIRRSNRPGLKPNHPPRPVSKIVHEETVHERHERHEKKIEDTFRVFRGQNSLVDISNCFSCLSCFSWTSFLVFRVFRGYLFLSFVDTP